MAVYVEIQEMVWNKYRVYGVESEQELKELLEKKGQDNLWCLDDEIQVEASECCLDFVYTNFDSILIYED